MVAATSTATRGHCPWRSRLMRTIISRKPGAELSKAPREAVSRIPATAAKGNMVAATFAQPPLCAGAFIASERLIGIPAARSIPMSLALKPPPE